MPTTSPYYTTDLLTVQWAREATPGTDLAATSKMIVEQFNPVPSTPEAYRPNLARGLLQRYRGGETILQRGTDWTAEGPLSYEQAQHWFSAAVQNVNAPTGSGPYVWTHTRNNLAAASLATFTLERRITEGSNPIDHGFHYAMVSELELTFNVDEVWRFNATGFARRQKDETITAALSLPTYETCLVGGTSIFLDSSWAGLGGTEIEGAILSGAVRFGSGYRPLRTLDGRTDLDFGAVAEVSSLSFFEAELTMLVNPTTFAAQKAAAEAQTLQALRIQIDGSDANHQIQIDALVKHRIAELYEFGEDDELYTVVLDFVEATDGTNAWRTKVTNNVASFA